MKNLLKSKILLAAFILVSALTITAQVVLAGGTLTSTSTRVGDAVNFTGTPDNQLCDPNQQTFDVYQAHFETIDLDYQGPSIDFNNASISVTVNGNVIPGFLYYRDGTHMTWFPTQKTIQY